MTAARVTEGDGINRNRVRGSIVRNKGLLVTKLKGLLYSNVVRNYAGKPEVVAALDAIPTVAEVYGDAKAPDLTCAWPMAFCGPAGMDEALADKICEVVSSIVDSPEYMQRVKDLGGTNTFQDFTRAEMREMMDRVDEQCKSFFGN